MPRTAYNQMVYSFQHKMELDSLWVMLHRIAILAKIEPVWYHCCLNSCIAHTGELSELSECPHCAESRLSPTGKPRRMFGYLPIIRRLQGFFQSTKSINQLLYRHNYVHIPNTIVFDGEHYRGLSTQHVARRCPTSISTANMISASEFAQIHTSCSSATVAVPRQRHS